MAGGLSNFERKLEQAISGVFAKAFRSAVQPVEIAAALQRETDNNTQILSRDRRLVPNDFHVELAPSDLDRLAPYDSALVDDLTGQLRSHAEAQGYVFPGPVSIRFEPAEDLTTGRFRIRSRAQASVTASSRTTMRQVRAFLEINGTRHPLQPPSTIVGRGTDTDIRINDPGISRQHVEFTVDATGPLTVGHEGFVTGAGAPSSTTGSAGAPSPTPGSAGAPSPTTGEATGVAVRDLGSTNGMLVDGHKLAAAAVRDGTQIRIGNTTITVRFVADDDHAPQSPRRAGTDQTGAAGV